MGKLFKKILCLGVVSFLFYTGFKFYLKIRAAINLDRSLPEYLKNIYGEDVKVDIKLSFKNVTISIICTNVLLEKRELVKKTIEDYILDFYPELNIAYLEIELSEIPENN